MTPQDSLAARSLRSVWHPCTQMRRHESTPPIAIDRAQGAWLVDTGGRRYLDAISSWWVNLFGHANPRINAALVDQLGRLEHAMLAGFTHEPVVRLSERLGALTGQALGHCFYASDGASAVEIALKMSVHAWRNAGQAGKNEFICIAGGYHGETVGALGVTDTPLFRASYEALLRPAHVARSPDARQARDGESAADVARQALADVERLLQQSEGRIAAVIVEPLVQCAAGMAMHEPAYVRGLRGLCDTYGAHLIADEIAVGCGRTGSFFACEQAGIWPDLLCLSKGISGGYLPLSLVMSSEAIYQAFYDDDVRRGFLHSHSYTGNPLACRAALETLAIFEDEQVLQRNRDFAQVLAAGLAPLAQDRRVRHVRQRGLIWACDAVLDDVDGIDAAQAASHRFSRRLAAQAAQRELLVRPIGTSVYVMPPYILDADQAQWLGERLHAAFDATFAEMRGA
ncbi:adenosylmethionine--8-amino-7-oxononanoate transaminase [Herbaspirillum frisingense]|uniref:adenosylmethionine--8-amino-7-oxononanoate transaminase n=1 Tax=Herbaspirillum frisingense TaxID=92645 RepID=UPI001602D267|nr:adenosylmethionine--8-amino-7-oxononanoate transaminase [Herbaspirillum frisingense]QNB07597.1 adenosylmethionine--8-amino-7-oxononanoate transaminase [Herbaspirillum frisingense]